MVALYASRLRSAGDAAGLCQQCRCTPLRPCAALSVVSVSVAESDTGSGSEQWQQFSGSARRDGNDAAIGGSESRTKTFLQRQNKKWDAQTRSWETVDGTDGTYSSDARSPHVGTPNTQPGSYVRPDLTEFLSRNPLLDQSSGTGTITQTNRIANDCPTRASCATQQDISQLAASWGGGALAAHLAAHLNMSRSPAAGPPILPRLPRNALTAPRLLPRLIWQCAEVDRTEGGRERRGGREEWGAGQELIAQMEMLAPPVAAVLTPVAGLTPAVASSVVSAVNSSTDTALAPANIAAALTPPVAPTPTSMPVVRTSLPNTFDIDVASASSWRVKGQATTTEEHTGLASGEEGGGENKDA